MDVDRRAHFFATFFLYWENDIEECKRYLKREDVDICSILGNVIMCPFNPLKMLRLLLQHGADIQYLPAHQLCVECLKMDTNGNYKWDVPLCQLLFEYGIPLEEKIYEDYMVERLHGSMRGDLLALRQQYPCIHWCVEPPLWEIQRLIWIAHLKEEEQPFFASLPVELIQMIIQYCGENHLTYSERRRKREIKRACTNDVSQKPL